MNTHASDFVEAFIVKPFTNYIVPCGGTCSQWASLCAAPLVLLHMTVKFSYWMLN